MQCCKKKTNRNQTLQWPPKQQHQFKTEKKIWILKSDHRKSVLLEGAIECIDAQWPISSMHDVTIFQLKQVIRLVFIDCIYDEN